MTIDEAIARERQVAEKHRNDIVPKEDYHNMSWIDENNEVNMRSAEEHEQLAEWLEELKRRREYDGEIIGSGTLNNEYNQGYNKALDDIVTKVKEIVGMDWEWDFCFIEQIAEQLKEGRDRLQEMESD